MFQKHHQNYMIRGGFNLAETSFERLCNLDALYDASYKVCRNVRWKDSVMWFAESRIENVLKAKEQLENDEYQQKPFSCFTIIERGKERDIRACHIADRLVQNTLCDQVLIPELTPKFIYDNCATLKNKGIDFALNRAKKHLQAAHRTYGLGNDFFAARIDIRKYFDSINHEALKRALKREIDDVAIQDLTCYLIDTFSFKVTKDKEPEPNKQYYVVKQEHYVRVEATHFEKNVQYYECENKSLGLGSQVSQLMALLMLNEVDHYAKEQLHLKFYGRYMDDIYILHNDSKYLAYCLDQIELKLQEIGLQMNRKKTYISRVHPIKKGEKKKEPFKYLKWNFYLTNTNKIIMIPFTKKIKSQRRKLRKMQARWLDGQMSTEDVQKSYDGWRAHMKKGTTFYIIQDMDNYFRKLFKGVNIL